MGDPTVAPTPMNISRTPKAEESFSRPKSSAHTTVRRAAKQAENREWIIDRQGRYEVHDERAIIIRLFYSHALTKVRDEARTFPLTFPLHGESIAR